MKKKKQILPTVILLIFHLCLLYLTYGVINEKVCLDGLFNFYL